MMQKKRSWKSEELSMFSRHFHHLLNSGIPLVSSIELLSDQKVISENVGKNLISSLQQGISLSEALRQEQFPDLFLSFIRAAEEHGDYVYGLKQCESYYEARARLVQDLIQACTYPLIVLICVGFAFFFMITVVLPRFAELYQTLGVKLPLITQYMLALTDVMGMILNIFLLLVFLLLLLIVFIRYSSRRWKRLFEKCLFSLPLLKQFYRMHLTHYVTIQLGSLLKSGVPLLQALILMKRLSPWIVLAETIQAMKERVVQGKPLHEAIRQNQMLFLPSFPRMVAIGERTGQLDQSLLSLAKSTEINLRAQMKRWVRSLEPSLIFLLGILIAVTVIAMFLPMLQMVQAI